MGNDILLGLYLFMVLANIIACQIGIVALYRTALPSDDAAVELKAPKMGRWVAASIGMLLLLMIALFGFLSHGITPEPLFSLAFNSPAYIGTSLYIPAAFRLRRRSKRHPAPPDFQFTKEGYSIWRSLFGPYW